MLLSKKTWDELGFDPKELERIGAIQLVPIPDVTMEGRDILSTARHAVTEAKELEEELDRFVENGHQPADLGVLLGEVIDLAIISLSAVHRWKSLLSNEELQNHIVEVLKKNSDRGYYDTEGARHWSECESGSYDQLRTMFSEEEVSD
jgi:hypothetical protein